MGGEQMTWFWKIVQFPFFALAWAYERLTKRKGCVMDGTTTETGAALIAAERERQQEKWAASHDDTHDAGELRQAAITYLTAGLGSGWGSPPSPWPFEDSAWKPRSDIQNLTKAGALIAAEIDRLQRERDARV
jgi:hypothetical protein